MKTWTALLCLACSTAGAQTAPVFRGETREVLIETVVTGKNGEPVGGLTAKNFRIWEDKKPQAIGSFSVEAGSTAVPRRMILLFDTTSMSVADEAYMKQTAAAFIDADANSGRFMAVLMFDGSLHVVQNFTEGGARLKQSIRDIGLTATSSSDRGVGPPHTQPGGHGLIQSLAHLARNLDAVPGRKFMVVFTSQTSFANVAPDELKALADLCNHSDIAVYPVLGTRSVQESSAGGPDCGEPPVGVVRPHTYSSPRSNPCVLRVEGSPATFANETGGFIVESSNDVLSELQKIGAEQDHYYALGFTPPDSKQGACHSLRVKVDRRGTLVHTRNSYCSSKPQDLLAESRMAQDLEKRAAASSAGSVTVPIEAPFFYGAPNVARVHVVLEIPTDALKIEKQGGKLQTQVNVLGIASAPDQSISARFSDVVKREFENQQELDQWKQTPLHYEKEFKIVPGQYRLSVVFTSGGTSFGKAEAPLAVDPYFRGEFAISGIALGSQIRPAANLGLEVSLTGEAAPLIAGDRQIVPAGSNSFAKPESAYCYFEVYSTRAAEPASVHPRILDRTTGAVKWDGGSANVGPAADGSAVIPVGLSLPIASLPPGSYLLDVSATDGEANARRTVKFEIH